MRELTGAMADLCSMLEELLEAPVWNKRGQTGFSKQARLPRCSMDDN
jgi:hypothetical protein